MTRRAAPATLDVMTSSAAALPQVLGAALALAEVSLDKGPVQQHALVSLADAEDAADVRARQPFHIAERDHLTLRQRQLLHEHPLTPPRAVRRPRPGRP